MSDRHVDLLRALAREPVQGRRGGSPTALDELVARGLAASTFVGHARIEVRITEAGTRVLAELDQPPPPSVYEVPAVREELNAFLGAWLPAVGEERSRTFKANLAFLIDSAVAHALDLESDRLRRAIGGLVGEDGSAEPTAAAALAAMARRPASPLRGRSSRSAAPTLDQV